MEESDEKGKLAGQKSDSICSLEITGKHSEKVSPIGWKMGSV